MAEHALSPQHGYGIRALRVRRLILVVVAGFHLAAIASIFQGVGGATAPMAKQKPIQVSFIAAPTPVPAVVPPSPPTKPLPVVRPAKPEPKVIATTASTQSAVAVELNPEPVSVQEPKPPAPIAEPAPVAVVIPPSAAAYLDNPKPVYPPASRLRRESGRVILRVRVDSAGRAAIVEVGTSSGYERLDDAAVEAVRRWRFKPAQLDNQPVADWVLVPIVFEKGGSA